MLITQQWLLIILDVFYHDLGQDQHYYIGWLATRDGIKELKKKKVALLRKHFLHYDWFNTIIISSSIDHIQNL